VTACELKKMRLYFLLKFAIAWGSVNSLEEKGRMKQDRSDATSLDGRPVNSLDERGQMQKDRLDATSLDGSSVNSLEERGQMKQTRLDATSLDGRQQLRVHAWQSWNGRLPRNQAAMLGRTSDVHSSVNSLEALEERGQMEQDRLDATSLDDILEDQLLTRLRVLPKNSDTSHHQSSRARRKPCRYLWGLTEEFRHIASSKFQS